MSAGAVVESLLRVGISAKDAYSDYLRAGGAKGWDAFLQSQEAQMLQTDLTHLVSGLSGSEVENAVAAIQIKKAALRNGRALRELSAGELEQYDALLNTEGVLIVQELKHPSVGAPKFLDVLVNQVLPVLVSTAKTVVPLLL